MSKSISLFLIEDNRLLREGIAAMLTEQPDFEVVGTASRGDAALLLLRDTKPRVVLLDSGLEDQDSLRLLRTLREGFPGTRVIVLDLLPAQQEIVEFIRAGVSGFIAKDATLAELVSAIRSVAEGRSVLPPDYTATIFSHVANQAVGRALGEVVEAVKLTNREREVIELIAQGLSNKEIAQRLQLSTETVKSHVHNALEKLALHSRLQLAVYARR
jgi:RNA polymerase sigma factor (sigma-70 family)